MSRIRRLSSAISEEGQRALAANQAKRIRDAAFSVVEQANLNASPTRKVTKKAAFTVVLRSLQSTRDLPFSLREHMALKELSQYIALAQSDKVGSLTLSNTDLLPISHPRSTRAHAMTASALSESRARWISDDPRISDDLVKTVLASALTAKPGSIEQTYYRSVLSNFSQGLVPSDVLIAATNPFAGGNSSAERSLRARLQRRDREGKFAFMGGGLSALIRRENGRVYNLLGRPIVDGPDGDDIQMQLPNGRIVNIPASKGMFVKAIIGQDADGFGKEPARTATTSNIINEKDLVYVDSPNGWNKVADNKWMREDGSWSVSKTKDKNGFEKYEISPSNSDSALSGAAGDWEDVLDAIADYEEKKSGKEDKNVEESEDAPEDVAPKAQEPEKGGNGEGPKDPGKFEFKYPEGAKKIGVDVSYDPEGRVDEESSDYSDDPVEIAQRRDVDEILGALERGVLPEEEGENAIGYGVLPFNRGDEFVPVEALYLALVEQGEDAEMELAKIYDKALGGSDNEDALNDYRKGAVRLDQAKPDIAESFERTIAMDPDEEPATEEPKFDAEEMDKDPLPPLLEGLSESELARFMESEDHTPYLPENEQIEMPVGYASLNPEPYVSWRKVTAENPDPNLPEGFSDNPVFIAQNIPTPELEKELRRSIEPGNPTPGYANIALEDEDGEQVIVNVPGEAVRDALQLQGVDVNALIRSIAEEGFVGQRPETDAPASVEDAIKADEDFADSIKNIFGMERKDALQKYEQKGPHDPLDPAYEGKLQKEIDGYLPEDGEFGDLLRANPAFARLVAWNQFDQFASPVHEEWSPSDQDVKDEFGDDAPADAEHAYVEGLYDAAPTPAVAIGAALQILRDPKGFYGKDVDKLSALKDALRALEDGDMRSDLKDSPDELNAVEAAAEDVKAMIEDLDVPSTEDREKIREKEVDINEILKLRAEGKSLDEVGEAVGLPREEVRRREIAAKREQEDALVPSEAPSEEPTIDVIDGDETRQETELTPEKLEFMKQEERLLLKLQEDTEGRTAIDAKPIVENQMRQRYGMTVAEAEAKLGENSPEKKTSKPRDLTDGEKAVIRNNVWVQENAGLLLPLEARFVQRGDFFWSQYYGRYEEVLETKYIGVLDRFQFKVFNVENNKVEIRYFKADSPLRNMRRPGIQDQEEGDVIATPKAAPRGGPRGDIKRVAPGVRVMPKEGRKVGLNNGREGWHKDKNGVALRPGDVVIYKDENDPKAKMWKRGVVKRLVGAQVEEGKKAGGLVRDGIVYNDYLFVQFEGDKDPYALKQGGRQLKAKNLILQEGDNSDIDLSHYGEKRAIPTPNSSPAEPTPAPAPAPVARQEKLLDTPENKPVAKAPGLPEPVYKAEVKDQKGNAFTVSVIKIDNMYEAAVFNADDSVSAVIAKDADFGEVQAVAGRFIGDLVVATDGMKVLRTYGDLPEPDEQLILTRDEVSVPEEPKVKGLALREAKIRANDLGARIENRELISDEEVSGLTDADKKRLKSEILSYIAPSGIDRRPVAKFNSNLVVAERYAVMLGWFDVAQELAAFRQGKEKLPLRPMNETFNNNIEGVGRARLEVAGVELGLHNALSWEASKEIAKLMDNLAAMAIYPDNFNKNFRNGLIGAKKNIDVMADYLNNYASKNDKINSYIDMLNGYKEMLDGFGELPKMPARRVESSDEVTKRLGEIARGFEGLSIDQLRNGSGDWKFNKELSSGLNKVYLLRNSLTGEEVVIKFDDDAARRDGYKFYGNGIKAEEMVAQLYRDLGFAQPGFRAINPDVNDPNVGGVGVMEYAGTGFFGLANVKPHWEAGIRDLDQIQREHRAELLDFVVANAIIGNTDRHGGNFMWGVDPATGLARLVPIDNGLALFNGAFGKAEKHQGNPLFLNPIKVMATEDYGNFNQVGRFARKWVQEIGDDAAKNQIVEFAQKMRDRAEAMKFVDPRANEYLTARADYVLKNVDRFLSTVKMFW